MERESAGFAQTTGDFSFGPLGERKCHKKFLLLFRDGDKAVSLYCRQRVSGGKV